MQEFRPCAPGPKTGNSYCRRRKKWLTLTTLGGPDLAVVEFGDEGEESGSGGVDVSGEGGDGGGEWVVVH